MESMIKVVTADDHPVVRQGLKLMIEADKSLAVIAQAGDGEEAIELIEQHRPDVAVLDIDMPKMSGFDVVRELQRKRIEVQVVFLTMHGDKKLFQAAMELGTKGYVLKDSAITDIVGSIKSVAAGRPFISPSLSGLLLERRRRRDELDEEQPGLHLLSPAEFKILKLIAEEKTSKEIAEKLFISRRTVDAHRANISRKLDLQGPLALTKFAILHRSEL
jgi:DNA-binding NarL/FixJ family response regulator